MLHSALYYFNTYTMIKKLLFLSFSLCTLLLSAQDNSKYTLSGSIKDAENNDPLIGATVVVKTASNWNGGSVKVKAVNCKGSSSNRSKNVARTAGCRTASSVVSSVVATESLSALTAFPNPTSGKATITFNSDRNSNYSLKVTDMIGKVLISQDLSVVEGYNMKDINLENMSKGIYMISVQTEDGNAQTLRLVVE